MFATGFVCNLGVCGFVDWCLCDELIYFNSRDCVDFFIKNLKQSHGIYAKKGLIIGHIGSLFFIFFFYVAFLLMCITMGYFFHVWGAVGVGLFFSCDKYLC